MDSITIVKKMCSLDKTKWTIDENNPEITAYRRRKLPEYMTTQVESRYPQYVTDSKLSEAFKDITVISLDINLEPFKQQIIS